MRDEATGKYEIFNNWKIDVVEVFATTQEDAIKTLSLTGITDYDDILKFIGYYKD